MANELTYLHLIKAINNLQNHDNAVAKSPREYEYFIATYTASVHIAFMYNKVGYRCWYEPEQQET